MKGSSHESFESHVETKMGSERSFGFIVGGIFLAVALWPVMHAAMPRLWALAIGLPLVALAAFRPGLLAPLNKVWFEIGLALGRLVSPIVLGIIYYLWITPIAFILRLSGKKFLALDFDAKAKSYWIIRQPAKVDAAARLRRPY